jgi:hypothetical protein
MTTATIETSGGNNSTINTDVQTGWNITQTGTTEMNDYELDDDNEGTLFIKNIQRIYISHSNIPPRRCIF